MENKYFKTKFITIIVILLSIGNVSKSKEYLPLAVDGSTWVVERWDEGGIIFNMHWAYIAKGDTTVNNTSYVKIYFQNLDPKSYSPPYTPIGTRLLCALIRDDVANKRVYGIQLEGYNLFNNCTQNQENLLYDFSKQIGDSISTCICIDDGYIITNIENITTDSYWANIHTKKFETSIPGTPFYGGIGSNSGLFERMFQPVKKGFFTRLERYSRNPESGLILGVKNETYKATHIIVENPVVDNCIKMIYKPDNECNLHIYNMQGIEVDRISVNRNSSEVFLKSTLKHGIYVFSLKEEDRIINQKVLIQK